MIEIKTPVWEQLAEQVLALSGGAGELVSASEKPWTSVTFKGSRHEIGLLFAGADGVAAGEALIAALPEHEFNLPGHIVADASVGLCLRTGGDAPSLAMTALLLVLDDV